MNAPILDVQQLSLQELSRHQILLHPLSFKVHLGECVALVGESGSGKSLTALSIPNLLPPSIKMHEKSQVIWQGKTDLTQLSEAQVRLYRGRHIGFIFQDPLHALNPVITIGAQLIEVLKYHNIPDAEREAVSRLAEVGLPEPHTLLNVYPCHLSGGQQQRVMIAMAMAARPLLLIADEPTTALDPVTQHHILSLLNDLRVKHNMGLLLISHDLRLIKRWADRVLVLEKGYLREQGTTIELFSHPEHRYTRRLMQAKPDFIEILKGRKEEATNTDESSMAILSLKEVSTNIAPENTQYLRSPFQLAPINLNLRASHCIGVIGSSGSGKTTLAKLIMGLIRVGAGKILYRGKDISTLTHSEQIAKRSDVQMIFQNPYASLNPSWTIEAILREPLELTGRSRSKKEDCEKLYKVLGQVELEANASILNRYPSAFSGGQRQRFALARALLLEPKILVCDEATSALDVSIQAEIIALLSRLRKEQGLGLLVIAHDLSMISSLADEVLVMSAGNVIEQGICHKILQHPMHPITQSLCAASH
ncbi:MAG: ABC transporter ATP-binding protein [Pseudomonadota bacterium]